MKSITSIILLILLAGCNTQTNYKTILLKTRGIVEIAPDEASIVIEISCIDKQIEKSKSCLIDKTTLLSEDLKDFSIPAKDIQTTNIILSREYNWINNSNIFIGYKASVTTQVKIRDLKILGELYQILLSNEQVTLSALTYSHSKIDSIHTAAYLNALDNANKLAEEILTRIPEKNKVITQISNVRIQSSESNPVELKRAEQFAEADQRALPINAGNIVDEQHLYVEYKVY